MSAFAWLRRSRGSSSQPESSAPAGCRSNTRKPAPDNHSPPRSSRGQALEGESTSPSCRNLAAALLCLPLLALFTTGAQAVVLVSNLGQADGGTGGLHNDHAQKFTTGSNGYKLTSVEMEFAKLNDTDAASVTWTATIRKTSGNRPFSAVDGTLTNPAFTTFTSDTTLTFTAPAGGISLDANTNYAFVLDLSAPINQNRNAVRNTSSRDEDSGAATGWSFHDGSVYRAAANSSGGTTSWSIWNQPKKIRINGSDGSDTTAPRITSITRHTPSTSPTNADTLKWRVTFNEPVQNVDAADFSITGTTATVSSVVETSGTIYDISISSGNLASFNTIVTLELDNNNQNIQDTSGNALTNLTPTGTNENTYEVDNLKPRVQSFTRQNPSTQSTSADTLKWRVTFNESVKNVDAADFRIVPNTPPPTTTATITSATQVTGNDRAYDVTASGGNLDSFNGTVRLGFNTVGHNIHDIAGNRLTSYGRIGANHNTFTVSNTVQPTNNAPTVANAIPNQSATVGTAFTYAFPTNTFNDADSDSLTYSATKSDDTALPSWLTFTTGTRTFSGTPQSGDVGTLSVKVTANDGNSGSISDTFNIVVSAAAPIIPTVDFSSSSSSVLEDAGTHNVTVNLSSAAPSGGLTLTYTVGGNATAGSGNDFTIQNQGTLNVIAGATTATIPVVIIDDSNPITEPVETVILTLTDGTGYTLGSTTIVHTLTITDNDAPLPGTPALTLSQNTLTFTEGTTGSYTIELATEPTATVTVAIESDNEDITISPSSPLTFTTTNWDTAQTVTVHAGQDDDTTDDSTILTHTASGGNYGTVTGSVTVTVNDDDTTINPGPTTPTTNPGGDNNNDTPPVVTPPVIPPVTVSAQALTLTEGTMAAYTLVLDSAPTTSVTIEITPLFSPAMSLLSTASVGSTAQDNPRITVTPSTVVFTPDNWQTPQSITVSAMANQNTTEQTVQLIHRIKGSNQRVASVTITIQERVITVSLSTPAQVTEGQTLTVTVTADTTPTVDLPIDVLIRETSDTDYIEDTEEGTKRVTLPAGQDRIRYSLPIRDNDTEDTQAGRVTLTIQPGTGYTVAGGTAQVVITDDEGQIATTPWLSRMGRTLAEQAIEGISARIHAARTPGLNATLAGWSVPMNPSSGESLDSEIHTLNPASQNPASGQTLNAQDILSNSQFLHTTGIDLRGGNTAWWGQVSETDFAGVQHDIHTQGESRTIQLGGDYAVNDWLMGMSVLHNSAEGDSQRRGNTERLESNVTALIPYSARDLGNTHLWGALGIGQGQVSRYRDNIQRSETDMTWRMISAGTRSELKQTETTSMALISDALWVRTESDESKQDNMNPQVSRIRAGLESTWNKSIRDIQIQPTFTIGARHDSGGAESGFGLYAGSGLHWTSSTLQIDIEGQYLLSHQQEIEEKGFSASLIHDRNPNSDLGLSVSLSQRSIASGGLPSLFTPQPLNITESRPRWMIDAQYGMPAFNGRFTGSPHIGLGLDGDTTDIELGWRMTPLTYNKNLSLGIQATRLTQEQTAPKHWFGVEARVRW